jgi:hypothetical protein
MLCVIKRIGNCEKKPTVYFYLLIFINNLELFGFETVVLFLFFPIPTDRLLLWGTVILYINYL